MKIRVDLNSGSSGGSLMDVSVDKPKPKVQTTQMMFSRLKKMPQNDVFRIISIPG